MSEEPIRLQKFLAAREVGSRRMIEDLIRAGDIVVNDQVAILGQRVTAHDTILVRGKVITQPATDKQTVAFYKPIGVESTLKKIPRVKTLADFDFGPARLFPIGRLDKDSHGLVLMTNDGAWANELAHPRYEHEKEYEVQVDKPLTTSHKEQLSNGTLIIGEKKVQPCVLTQMNKTTFRIILKEGRNRQIRRMCEACGLTVKDLLRIRMNEVRLEDLTPGKWRSLS